MSLGDVIRGRREELSLTQDQVAGRVGISKPYLSNIETERVKNPPSDGVIDRLEQALEFDQGKLRKMAHLVRTPLDVRQEHEKLSAEVDKLRGLLRELLATGKRKGKVAGVSLDTWAKRLKRSRGNVREVISAGTAVPIINRVAAGYPHHFTDLDYPPSVADEYVRVPDVHDPQAFAARVVGDSMEPNYREGDVVVFSPNSAVKSGDDCFVRFGRDHSTTFKRFFAARGGKIRLKPLNKKYPVERRSTACGGRSCESSASPGSEPGKGSVRRGARPCLS